MYLFTDAFGIAIFRYFSNDQVSTKEKTQADIHDIDLRFAM